MDLWRLERKHVFHPWTVQQDDDEFVAIDGEGIYFYDTKGTRFMDMSSQLMNLNLGFKCQEIISAIKDQCEKLCFVAPHIATEPKVKLAQKLSELTPGDLVKVFFTVGGSEANEMAVTMARIYTGRRKVMARYRSYHGTTSTTLGISGDPRRIGIEPFVSQPETIRYPDPYCYRCFFQDSYPQCNLKCLSALEEIIRLEGPGQIAAILFEPVTGSNGCIVPPDGYVSGLRALCNKYEIVLIADEVITGFGRTGKWFGMNLWDVAPDIMTMAKGINSGYIPLGAAVVSKKIANFFENHYLPIGFTYTGHALACASGLATLDFYQNENLIDRAAETGKYLTEQLQNLAKKHCSVGEVRGVGLIHCLELVNNQETKEALIPWNAPSKYAKEIKSRLLAEGLATIFRWNIIFVAPPLIITESEIDEAIQKLDRVLAYTDTLVD